MREELQKKLFDSFPLLYSRVQTTEYLEISCGDGWFDIIYDLSSKLETIIMYIRENNKYEACSVCGCDCDSHYIQDGKKPCSTIHKLPFEFDITWSFSIPEWKRNIKNFGRIRGFRKYIKEWFRSKIWRIKYIINKIMYWLYVLGIHQKKPCHCLDYTISHPRVIQIKEKWGSLRFYTTSTIMTKRIDKIDKYITEAERLSETTCENCGKPGIVRHGGWIKVLCDSCNEVRYVR